MKVFRPNKKPSRWEIVYYIIIIVIGFACRRAYLPGDGALLQSVLRFGRALMPVGIGGMIGLAIRWSHYHSMSPEGQRDEDRQDRDERNLMIRDRAAWMAYNVLVGVLAVIGAVFAIMDNWGIALLSVGMSVFGLVTWMISVVWVRGKQL